MQDSKFIEAGQNVLDSCPLVKQENESQFRILKNIQSGVMNAICSYVKFSGEFQYLMKTLVFYEEQCGRNIDEINSYPYSEVSLYTIRGKNIVMIEDFLKLLQVFREKGIKEWQRFQDCSWQDFVNDYKNNISSYEVKELTKEIKEINRKMKKKKSAFEHKTEEEQFKLRKINYDLAEENSKFISAKIQNDYYTERKIEFKEKFKKLEELIAANQANLKTFNEENHQIEKRLNIFEEKIANFSSQMEKSKKIEEFLFYEKEQLEMKIEKETIDFQQILKKLDYKIEKNSEKIDEYLKTTGHETESAYIFFIESMVCFMNIMRECQTKLLALKDYIECFDSLLKMKKIVLGETGYHLEKVDINEKFSKDKMIELLKKDFPNNDLHGIFEGNMFNANLLIKIVRNKPQEEIMKQYSLTEQEAVSFIFYFENLLDNENFLAQKQMIKSQMKEIERFSNFKKFLN